MSDVAKISEGLSRPRIDPRKFVDVGIVDAVNVSEAGVNADVTTMEGVPETAAYSPPYAGPGYGLHLPMDIDDAVVMVTPDGVSNAGLRIVGRTWDAGSPAPADVVDNPEDVVLVVKPGQSVRLIVTGGGHVVLEPRDGGKIKHGGDDADDPLIRKVADLELVVAKLNAVITSYIAHVHTSATAGAPTSPPLSPPPTPVTNLTLPTLQTPAGSPVAVST